MTDTTEVFKQSTDHMMALTRSWMQNWMQTPGAMPSAPSEEYIRKINELTTDLMTLYAEAIQRHLDPSPPGSHKLARDFTALTRSHNPQDLVDFQRELIGAVLEGVSRETEIWAAFADKLACRYAQLSRDMAADIRPDETAPDNAQDTTRAAKPHPSKPRKRTNAKAD